MKRGMIVATVAALAAAGLTALAQEQGGKPNAGYRRPGPQAGGDFVFGRMLYRLANNPKAAENLGLTPEQVAKLKAKVEEMKAPREELMAKLRAAQKQERKLMQADVLDEAALLKGVEETGALRLEMARMNIRALVAVRSILTPEQAKKLREHVRQRMQEGQGEKAPPPPPPPPPAE